MKDYKAGDIVVCVQLYPDQIKSGTTNDMNYAGAGWAFEKVFTVNRISKDSKHDVLWPEEGNGVYSNHVLPLLEYIAKKYPVGTVFKSVGGLDKICTVEGLPYNNDPYTILIDSFQVYNKEKGFAEIISKPEEKQTKTMNNKKIIGYKCPMDIQGIKAKKGDVATKIIGSDGSWYMCGHWGSGLPAEIVEQWEPVYEKPKPELPEINGYKGSIRVYHDVKYAIYGCDNQFKYSLTSLKELYGSMKICNVGSVFHDSNRHIKLSEIEQIIAALEYKDN